jgi:hypothetical protein
MSLKQLAKAFRSRFGSSSWSKLRLRNAYRKNRRPALEPLEDRTLLSVDLNQLFVDRAYANLLGRTPEPAAEQAWISLLRTGVTPQAVAVTIEQSDEFWARQVRVAYQNFLRRDPEDAGFQAWVHNRQAVGGEVNLDAFFLSSSEYLTNSASTINGFLHAIYNDVLGRDPDDVGLNEWGSMLQGGATDLSVAAGVLASPEANQVLVSHFYHQYLTRAPEDDGGPFAWAIAVDQGLTREDMRAQFVGSQEFFNSPERLLEHPVLRWNQVLLETIRRDATAPPLASRNMAIVQASVADAVNAINGTPAYMVSMAAPSGASVEAAVAGAAHQALVRLYPGQQAQLDAELADALSTIPDGQSKTDGMALGQSVADAISARRQSDGWNTFVDFQPQDGPGQWRPTPPMFEDPLTPQWANLQPFVMTSPDQFRPPGPPALESSAYSAAVNEIESLGRATGSTRTPEQTHIARFWADGSGTYTPPGHWNLIAEQAALQHGNGLADDARLFAQLDFALADAAIVAWDAKFHYTFWRPITAIREAATADNPNVQPDPTWTPLIVTPPFPEYISGHSTFSGTAATILTAEFGDNVSVDTTSLSLPGVVRSFANFQAAADEAGRSRVYGGIHYQFSNQDGLAAGRALGQFVFDTLTDSNNSHPPRVMFTSAVPTVVSANTTIQGQVLANSSGVQSLQVQVDGGAITAVPFDGQGNFSFTTNFPLDGTAQGSHVVGFQATDNAGNVSSPFEQSFVLDTLPPAISLSSPSDGGSIDETTRLTGTADGTGSSITRLVYVLDGGTSMPITYDHNSGAFDQALDLSRLGTGSHTLAITAEDTAGLESTKTITVSMAAAIPFQVSRVTPVNGAGDVGSTFRPQVFFTRPVDPTSLTADDFFATGPSGDKLPAHIVPAADGSFAWLFFAGPMPGGAQITVHLIGNSIRAAADGALLDADMSMMPGSTLTYSFTTVSLTPLFGTSLSGTVVDPGPDLIPGTFDDVRAGPSGVLHTPQDRFLLPIAGVKVFIIGMEDQAVFTDAAGNFHFDSVPAGDIKLSIDGRTATSPPDGFYFPEMVMDLTITAGRANTVMGTMGTPEEMAANRDRQEVYLPRLRTSLLHDVSPTQPTMIAVAPESAPDLTDQQRAMLSVEVQPGSMVDPQGNAMTSGQVGISTVPPQMVREMLPPGVMQHTFDITIQAPGVANFTAPAPLTFPNIFNAAPGTRLNFLSFDHTTGRLVIDGTATVSADGLSVHTDPGMGVTHPGWHGLTPPGGQLGPDGYDDQPQMCPLPMTNSPTISVPPLLYQLNKFAHAGTGALTNADDFLFTSSMNNQYGVLEFRAAAGCNILRVQVNVDFSNSQFFVGGLTTTTFLLSPAHPIRTVQFRPSPLTAMLLRTFDSDRLYGARVTITISRGNSTRGPFTPLPDPLQPTPFFVYRYIDASDDDPNDQLLKFNDTLNDGAGGVTRLRQVTYMGASDALPTLSANSLTGEFAAQATVVLPGQPSAFSIIFDPTHVQDGITAGIQVADPAGRLVNGPGTLSAVGNGIAPLTVYLNEPEFDSQMALLVADATPVRIELDYTAAALAANTPFQIQVVAPGMNTTAPGLLHLGAGETEVENALETLESVGPGSVQVTLSHTSIAGTPNIQDVYTVTPISTSAFGMGPTPPFLALGSRFTSHITRVSPRNLLTQNQRALFATQGLRHDFFNLVMTSLADFYQPIDSFNSGVTFSPLAPSDRGQFAFEWALTSPPQTAEFATSAFSDLRTFLASNRSGLNRVQVAFRVGQILSSGRRDSTAGSHLGTAYLPNFFRLAPNIPFDAGFFFLSSYFTEVLAHEVGHGLNLPHVAHAFSAPGGANEVQIVSVNSGVANITLSLGGDTVSLPSNASAADVQAALLSLRGMGSAQLTVTGPRGGPYQVPFAGPSFGWIHFPPITGVGIAVRQVADATPNLRFGPEIVIGNNRGRNDVMLAQSPFPGLSFQPLITQPILRMSLGLDWSPPDGTLAMTVFARAAATIVGGESDLVVPLPGPGQTVAQDPDAQNPPIPGRGLAVFAVDGELSPDTLDFGTVEANAAPDQAAVQHLTLVNILSEDITVRGIRVVNTDGSFSTPIVPITVLHSGDTIDIPITFDPLSEGPFTGTLVIDSDAENFDGRFDLTGTGRRTTADLQIVGPGLNFQGLPVGTRDFTDPDAGIALRNDGVLPVTITGARIAAGPGADEFIVTFTNPVVIQPNEIGHIQLGFAPSAAGLRHGIVEILSNDPNHPILHFPVVGTGLADGNLHLGNDYVAVESQFREFDHTPVLRTRTDANGNWQLFLPPDLPIHIVIFDPISGLVSHTYAVTNDSGQLSRVEMSPFAASGQPDSDGDGLPDDAEFAIGTNPHNPDTNGDGISDFNEVEAGLNPLSGQPVITGVVAGLDLNGEAKDIKVAADPANPGRQLAYVALANGLAIVDVSRFDHPVLLGQLSLSGLNTSVALDSENHLAAVAADMDGVHLVDVTDPTHPMLRATIPIDASGPMGSESGRVDLFEGLVYVASGSDIVTFDTVTLEEVQRISLGDTVAAMRRDGTALFALTDASQVATPTLHVIDVSGVGMVARGTLVLPHGGRDLFVADGVAWISSLGGGDSFAQAGLMTADVRSLDHPALISDISSAGQFAPRGFALNGSGLGIFTGAVAGPISLMGGAGIINASDPSNTGAFFTQFGLPAQGEAVALASGLAYVADGVGGLQVVNYLSFEQGGQPPTISVDPVPGDLDPNTPGVQLLEGSDVTLPAHITDDVQVRNVELLLNGVVVRNLVSFPYDLTATLPLLSSGVTQAVLQIRATDTGGNSALSDPITIDLLRDTTPPAITSLVPPEGSTQPLSFHTISIQFSKQLDTSTVTAINFVLMGPGGVVAPVSVRTHERGAAFDFDYPALQGDYQFIIHAANVTDRVGNPLGAADIVRLFHVGNIVHMPTIRWINPAGGFWDDPANWDAGRLPGPSDDVLIDVPGNVTITFRDPNAGSFPPQPVFASTIRSLVSNNPFSIIGGHFVVTETMQINNLFQIGGVAAPGPDDFPTLAATVLQGDGGQGITFAGSGKKARLDGCIIEAPLTLVVDNFELRIHGGLSLLGTATITGTNAIIRFEGDQTITQGEFVVTGTAIDAIGPSRVTFGPQTFWHGASASFNDGPNLGDQMTLTNFGRIVSDTGSITAPLTVRPFSFTNHAILQASNGSWLLIDSPTWTNSTDGQILADHGNLELGVSTTTTWLNAGTLSLTNQSTGLIAPFAETTMQWSNTGSILSQDSNFTISGRYSSASVENFRRTGGLIVLRGIMNNTGRTLTFDAPKGSWTGQGTIIGGTLVLNNPIATLDVEGLNAVFDGVTLNGLLEVGVNHQGDGGFFATSALTVRNGLTINGTVVIDHSSASQIDFEGTQTVHGGIIAGRWGTNLLGFIITKSGDVTFDTDVTFQGPISVAGATLPNIASTAIILGTVLGDAHALGQGGVQLSNVINRGTITIPSGGFLAFDGTNEGSITIDQGQFFLGGTAGDGLPWHNVGAITCSGTDLKLRGQFTTDDIGNLSNPNGFTSIFGLDNTNRTFVIDSRFGSTTGLGVSGGTVRIDPAIQITDGVLKDVVIEGNLGTGSSGSFPSAFTFVGEVTIHGTVMASLTLGDGSHPDLPVVIHSGELDLLPDGRIESDPSMTAGITFGQDVTLRGGSVEAIFGQALLNLGTIRAEQGTLAFDGTGVVTNRGVLEAMAGATLQLDHLAPNEGIIRADAGGIILINNGFTQTSTGTVIVELAGTATNQIGLVQVSGNATLAGTLEVVLVAGFAPQAGDTFEIMTYNSHAGTFATIIGWDPPRSLVYNDLDLKLAAL